MKFLIVSPSPLPILIPGKRGRVRPRKERGRVHEKNHGKKMEKSARNEENAKDRNNFRRWLHAPDV